jgi:arylsulfatase A-like enzyme
VCGIFGKWGLGHEGSSGLPTRQGFDEFFGYLDQHHAHNYYPTFLIQGEQRVPLKNVVPREGEFGQGVATEQREYSPDLILAAALSFVERHQRDRFFLYFPITLPHANNEGQQSGLEIPSVGAYADRDWPPQEQAFAAMVSRMDGDFGAVLDKLKQLKLNDNTLVFFTSDNGPHAEGGQDPEFFHSSGPLRGIKRDLYEGGIRAPLIVRWPQHIAAGSVTDHPAYLGDVMAVLCELTGVPLPPGRDSISFLPALLGRPGQQAPHEYLYWDFYEQGFKQALLAGDWKYLRMDDREELYNLRDDPGETHDLAAQEPARLARMREQARAAYVPSPEWPIPPPWKGRGRSTPAR